MIQEIYPHIYKNEYIPRKPEKKSFVCIYRGKEVLLKDSEDIVFPTIEDLEKYDVDVAEKMTYLFTIDKQSFYLGEDLKNHIEGYCWKDTELFRRLKPQYLAFAGITGYQLYRWYQSHKFCGKCGKKMVQDGKERMVKCEKCGQMEYPKISPAVIVGVINGKRLLLSKYADRDYKKYALIAGYAEIGETIEETVKREVMEEVGLKVKNIRFYKSQPWSFTDTLLFGFFADLDGEDKITLDTEELALAEWFEREDIPIMDKNISLTNEMILHFKKEKDIDI
ncbi:NAD(+) diphosphatase [Faecalimonas sp.]